MFLWEEAKNMKSKTIGIFICYLISVSLIVPTTGMLDQTLRHDWKHVVSSQLTTESDTPSILKYTVLDAEDGYVRLVLENSSGYYAKVGNPQIPKLVKHVELPFAATNVTVSLTISGWHEQIIAGAVIPTQESMSYAISYSPNSVNFQKNTQLYASSELYPSTWFLLVYP